MTLSVGFKESKLSGFFISGGLFHSCILKGDCVVNLRRERLTVRVSWKLLSENCEAIYRRDH